MKYTRAKQVALIRDPQPGEDFSTTLQLHGERDFVDGQIHKLTNEGWRLATRDEAMMIHNANTALRHNQMVFDTPVGPRASKMRSIWDSVMRRLQFPWEL